MPVVAVVDGVRIVFYANEHPSAHFHALIGRASRRDRYSRLEGHGGVAASGEARKVLSWAAPRKEALLERFASAIAHEKGEAIE